MRSGEGSVLFLLRSVLRRVSVAKTGLCGREPCMALCAAGLKLLPPLLARE